MRNKKSIGIGVLCAIVAIMAVGYAALATQLNINGIASIDSTWRVEITNITEKDKVGDATNKVDPSYTATTANFSVGLIQPGDSITYDIEVSNLGTLKAKVDSINVIMDDNDAITYTTTGLEAGDKLGVGEKDTLSVTVSYNPEVTSQPSITAKEITVTIDYVQDLGENTPITYDIYSVGDTVTFAGSNWYVIKNSTREEDYVTLMKENVLTNAELGEYAYNDTYDAMSYYWSDTCHADGYGYTDYVNSGCEGHNDYEGSKVKEYLEGTYINTLGADNLQEVDGYKIRLIKLEELQNNLGYATQITGSYYEHSATNTPSWVYQNFGENKNGLAAYWTMTPHPDYSYDVWYVLYDGQVRDGDVCYSIGVRPVINLLKSSI